MSYCLELTLEVVVSLRWVLGAKHILWKGVSIRNSCAISPALYYLCVCLCEEVTELTTASSTSCQVGPRANFKCLAWQQTLSPTELSCQPRSLHLQTSVACHSEPTFSERYIYSHFRDEKREFTAHGKEGQMGEDKDPEPQGPGLQAACICSLPRAPSSTQTSAGEECFPACI